MKESARHVKIVERSEEDECYVGSSPSEIPLILPFGFAQGRLFAKGRGSASPSYAAGPFAPLTSRPRAGEPDI